MVQKNYAGPFRDIVRSICWCRFIITTHSKNNNNEKRETENGVDEDREIPRIDDLENTSKGGTNDESTTNERYAPYHDSPTYHENEMCLLTATGGRDGLLF